MLYMYVCMYVCMFVGRYVCMYVWACGVVGSMCDFHRCDRGSIPCRVGEIFIMITTKLHCGTIGECLIPIYHRLTQVM